MESALLTITIRHFSDVNTVESPVMSSLGGLTRVYSILGQTFASLEYGNCKELLHAPIPMQCFTHVKSQFREKNTVLPIEKFPPTCRNMMMLQYLIIQFPLYYLSSAA